MIFFMKPVRASKIRREIRHLEDLRGGPHIAQLLDVVQDPDMKSIALILAWAENQNVRTIVSQMTINDVAIYTRGVLEAFKFAHLRGIKHRDIKPGNIMFDLTGQRMSVVDWGLADYCIPVTAYYFRVAARNYKGPELLFNFTQYNPSLDIWYLGCTLASLFFRRVPLFKSIDNSEQIVRLAGILAGKEIVYYAEKYRLDMPPGITAKIAGKRRKAWHKFVPENGVATDLVLDLLNQILTINRNQRISAADALNHLLFHALPGSPPAVSRCLLRADKRHEGSAFMIESNVNERGSHSYRSQSWPTILMGTRAVRIHRSCCSGFEHLPSRPTPTTGSNAALSVFMTSPSGQPDKQPNCGEIWTINWRIE
jgi:casein kinase II subunit alpha